ncbi:sensor histidine kinase [Lichenifustis flavocetrariae]|uniref:histidine kinase n=1 Tax=Lichenifustis flavocetrariae TaxID=2949735 RepID=A0AA42CRU1_9HYPH|nr:HAMP domain-containing sensor histidine kinase [Lichenifustis flavocetrariae]MCW6512815.1 HAMP domain-containing histidine kinase [Lichenifustis flavocetrariae]
MRRVRYSLFWRLSFGMVAVSALALVASVVFLYLRFEATTSRFREDTLRTFVGSILRDEHSAGRTASNRVSAKIAKDVADAGGRFAIVASGGGLVAASSGVTEALIPPEDTEERSFTLQRTPKQAPVYGLSLRIHEADSAYFIQVEFPSSEIVFDSVLEEFIVDIAWIWIPFLLILLIVNLLVARLTLRPLSEAARQAESIGPGSVLMRLNVRRVPPEVSVLVQAVNHAFDRLQIGQKGLEEFVADVAHELRTPLAVIKAQLSASHDTVSRELGRDFAQMERLVLQLLDRVKLGGLHFEPDDCVDLCELARETAAFLAPLIVMKQRSIAVIAPETPIYVSGARDYLFRALRNLVENAVEHTPMQTTVRVVVKDTPSITVLDDGPGFPPQRLDPELRRKQPLRSDRSDGIGLGLSITERTMIAHNGTLDLENPPEGGASATLHFPLIVASPPWPEQAANMKTPLFQH